jgi:hypothetical protein
MSNGSPLLHGIPFFPKNKLFSVMSNCSTNCGKDLKEEKWDLEPNGKTFLYLYYLGV